MYWFSKTIDTFLLEVACYISIVGLGLMTFKSLWYVFRSVL